MKLLMISVLLSLVVAGCSPAASPSGGQPPRSTNEPGSGGLSSTVIVIQATGTPSSPGGNSSSSSNPLVITVRPPAVPLGPDQTPLPPSTTPPPASPANWLTFTSLTLKVAVDYPADWTVTVGTNGATFTSSQGQTILLQPGENQSSPGCTPLTNAAGLTAQACSDTASGSYTATFEVSSAGGSAQAVALSTTDAAALEVYKAMINSLRPSK